jgi:hypothetical protein
MARTNFGQKSVFWRRIVVLSSVLAIAGCSETPLNGPASLIQPENTSGQKNRIKPVLRKAVPFLAKKRNNCLGTTKSKKLKHDKGGKIKHCGHKLEFPPYALSQDAIMSIEILPTSTIDVNFGPDGSFDIPVTVTICYKDADLTGIDEEDLTIAWYDEISGQWVDIGGTVDTKKQTVSAETDHFTQYTLSFR